MGNLNTHMLTHRGEKSYPYEVCGKSFLTNNKLKVHIVNHTGEKLINVVHVIIILQECVI